MDISRVVVLNQLDKLRDNEKGRPLTNNERAVAYMAIINALQAYIWMVLRNLPDVEKN